MTTRTPLTDEDRARQAAALSAIRGLGLPPGRHVTGAERARVRTVIAAAAELRVSGNRVARELGRSASFVHGLLAEKSPDLPEAATVAAATERQARSAYATRLPAVGGVLARNGLPHRMSISLIELAAEHGWRNPYYDDLALVRAGWSTTPPPPHMATRLARARGEALTWLRTFAVPEGFVLHDLNDSIVLAPAGHPMPACPRGLDQLASRSVRPRTESRLATA